jgi:hypothetical protein
METGGGFRTSFEVIRISFITTRRREAIPHSVVRQPERNPGRTVMKIHSVVSPVRRCKT